MRHDILEKKEDILRMIHNHEPKTVICKFLNCKHVTLNSYLKKLNINYSGNMGMKGKKTDKKRKSALEYIKKDVLQNSKLRKKHLHVYKLRILHVYNRLKSVRVNSAHRFVSLIQ
mgnify:CR=1 FL=1